MDSQLFAISPLDGRYYTKVKNLFKYFSEMALMKHRAQVEIEWLIYLSSQMNLDQIDRIDHQTEQKLRLIYNNFNIDDAKKIKSIEQKTNHDVKSIEYFLRDKLDELGLPQYKEFLHIFCTSEDINNLAYNLMIKNALKEEFFPQASAVYWKIVETAIKYKDSAMLCRTHGQPASPSTMGKELINFAARLKPLLKKIKKFPLKGKFNGAVGNFNAHFFTYPEKNWLEISKDFIEKLGLEPNLFTTQIEPHDQWAELFYLVTQINTILTDFSRDIWTYISIDYFKQKKKENEVGSSTMPHKVNPIDFENAEGNFGMANSIASHLSSKLPISRLQRDLSDSTVQRNIGLIFGYSILAYQSLSKGIGKLELNADNLAQDLDNNYQVLGEAIQSYLRTKQIENSYDILKKATRGNKITKENYQELIDALEIENSLKRKFRDLTPESYIGIAENIIDNFNPEL